MPVCVHVGSGIPALTADTTAAAAPSPLPVGGGPPSPDGGWREGTDMRTPRLAGLGLGIAAVVAVAGCGANGNTPGAGASTPPSAPAGSGAADPAATSALAAAAATLGTTSFKITITAGPGAKLTGFVDAPHNKGTADLVLTGPNAELTVKTLMVVQDLYVQVPGITKTGTWTHLDGSRLPDGANVGLRPGQIDPARTSQLLSSTTDVRQVGARNYQGSVDLTKVAGITGIDQVTVDGLGADAKRVPFTAGLDEQGRLSVITIQVPAAKGKASQPVEVLYSDYGTTVTADRPAPGEITEAPESIYKTLGG
jgi:hypothetical protein